MVITLQQALPEAEAAAIEVDESAPVMHGMPPQKGQDAGERESAESPGVRVEEDLAPVSAPDEPGTSGPQDPLNVDDEEWGHSGEDLDWDGMDAPLDEPDLSEPQGGPNSERQPGTRWERLYACSQSGHRRPRGALSAALLSRGQFRVQLRKLGPSRS